ncbi:MAG: hypothetical protein ACFCVF_05930 [Kineosporiaceae bacterium]
MATAAPEAKPRADAETASGSHVVGRRGHAKILSSSRQARRHVVLDGESHESSVAPLARSFSYASY